MTDSSVIDSLVGVSPLGFLAASLLVIVAPGPDMAIVARNTIARGRLAGLQTAAGALCGVSVHVFAAVAGLSAIFASSAFAFSAVKLVGAAYLVVLGGRALLSSGHAVEGDPLRVPAPFVTAPSSPAAQGLLSAVLNPKLAVFFLTFLPQFVDADHLAELGMLAHGAVFIIMASVWLALWVLGMDHISAWMRRASVRIWLERLTGGVLIAMGLRLAVAER